MKRAALMLIAGATGLSCSHPPAYAEPDGGDGCARLNHISTDLHTHLPTCGDPACGNGVNPPTGGDHCAIPLACQEFATAQPRCQWIHNLEHGHVVFAYNCPAGCPETVAALEQLRASLPVQSNGVPRSVMTPDPALPHQVAVVVWGWSYSAEDVDPAAIRCLMSHQDEEAPEHGLSCAAQ